MNLARRDVLRAGAAAGLLAVAGCDRTISVLTGLAGQAVPDGPLASTAQAAIDPAVHLLSRAGYGPWPGDVAQVRAMGRQAWLAEQLDPERIDDTLCDLRARRFESLHASVGELFEYRSRVVRDELRRATLLRAIYSKRQLLEVMVRFWSDHLNIDMNKGDCAWLKTADDRDVIRSHALSSFRGLIRASALSPAMLVYLDGNENHSRTPGDAPNENYARELLELHTLGVHGGYTQQDVMEAARCLTGWRVKRRYPRGAVVFEPDGHDDGEKLILGQRIAAGGGAGDIDRLIDIVCAHPATAQNIATKLCRRFVSDDPPAALIARVAAAFGPGGDIKAALRTLIESDSFAASAGLRFKRPFRFVVSALRALAADTHGGVPLMEFLQRMGQPLFAYPTPDGYPDEPAPWLGTLLWRWNFSLALVGDEIPGARGRLEALLQSLSHAGARPSLPRAFSYFVGRAPTPSEAAALGPLWERDPSRTAGLILASPAFQRT